MIDRWTEDEKMVLRHGYGNISKTDLLGLLPGRTWRAIGKKARKMGLGKSKRWTDEEVSILLKFYGSMSAKEMLKKLPNRTFRSIQGKIDCLNLVRVLPRWSEDEENIIREFYGKIPGPKILKKLPFRTTWSSVVHKARRLGVRADHRFIPRKFAVDDLFFESTNVCCSYVSGFIAADGSINDKRQSVKIALSVVDRGHLERIKDEVWYEGQVHIYKGTVCELVVPSQRWVEDLRKNFNITPRKTYTLLPPTKLSEDCALSYIVGYIDGDGCIRRDNRGRLYLEIGSSSKDILVWIKWQFDSILPESSSRSPKVIGKMRRATRCRGERMFYRYRLGGSTLMFIIKRLLKLKVPRLRRKWEPAVNFLKEKGYDVDYDYYSY